MKATLWLKVQAKKRYGRWDAGHVQAFKTKPGTEDNEVAFKIDLEIPDSIFEEPIYEVKLTLPNTTRQLPSLTEITPELEKSLNKKLGFRVKIDIPPEAKAMT